MSVAGRKLGTPDHKARYFLGVPRGIGGSHDSWGCKVDQIRAPLPNGGMLGEFDPNLIKIN